VKEYLNLPRGKRSERSLTLSTHVRSSSSALLCCWRWQGQFESPRGVGGWKCVRTWNRQCSAVSRSEDEKEVRHGTCSFATLSWSFLLTRLETRTKESNIYASIWVVQTSMRNESDRWEGVITGIIGRSIFICQDLSRSITVGTRKMVIYAWIEWRPSKGGWKFEAILTCKSFVWFGYRGERLIELSSTVAIPWRSQISCAHYKLCRPFASILLLTWILVRMCAAIGNPHSSVWAPLVFFKAWQPASVYMYCSVSLCSKSTAWLLFSFHTHYFTYIRYW